MLGSHSEEIPHDYNKEINRLRAANEYQRKQKFAREHIPTGENYQKNRNLKPKQLCTTYSRKEKVTPDMYIDVTICPGKSGRIDRKSVV